MNKLSRHSLLLAIAASLAMPAAFAQDATTGEATEAEAAMQSTTPTEAAPVKKSWNDVDLDKDGALSQTEAAAVPALGQVFTEADVDADGSLTAEEYQAYVAKVQAGGGAAAGATE